MLLRSMMQAMYTPRKHRPLWLGVRGLHPLHQPRFAATRTCCCTGSSKPSWPASPTTCPHCLPLARRRPSWPNAWLSGSRPPESAPATRSRVAQAQMQGWEAAGLHCSANERRADEASRDVEAWLKCKYMRDYLGEEFSGTVSRSPALACSSRWMTMYVEGLVHISELGGTTTALMRCAKSCAASAPACAMPLARACKCRSSRVDLDARRIDFCLVQEERRGKEGKDLAAAPPPQRGPGRSRAARRTAALLQQQEQERDGGGIHPPMHALMRP